MTFSEVIEIVLAVCGGITTAAVAVSWVIKGIHAATGPEKKKAERMSKIEKNQAELMERMDETTERLDRIDETNKIELKALLALINHTIDGNDVDEIKEARDDIEGALIKGA